MITINNFTLHFRNREDINEEPYAFTQVNEFEINNDLLTCASSTITCDWVPSNVKIGDICILVDYAFKKYYAGVIDTIENNKIVAYDLLTLLDYDVAMPKDTKFTWNLASVHVNYLQYAISQCKYWQRTENKYYYDRKQINFFNSIRCTSADTGETYQRVFENNEVKNIYDEMLEVQKCGYVYKNNCNIHLPSRRFGTEEKDKKLTLACYENEDLKQSQIWGDMGVDINVVRENPQYNKISVFWETPRKDEPADIKYDRGCYYLGLGGRTQDPDSPTREHATKNKAVFTDEPSLTAVLNKELNRQLYNHKIEIKFSKDIGVINFFDFELGQLLQILDKNKVWNSVYTANKIVWKRDAGNVEYTMYCGFVRNKATQFWFQSYD